MQFKGINSEIAQLSLSDFGRKTSFIHIRFSTDREPLGQEILRSAGRAGFEPAVEVIAPTIA